MKDSKIAHLLGSRKFWSALFVVLLLLVAAVFPGFPDVGEYLTEIATLIAAYIIGVALDPGKIDFDTIGQKLLAVLKSRKFIAAIAGLIVVIVKAVVPDFPLDETQLTTLIYTIAAYILGTGIEDNILQKRAEVG